ncbi:DUF6264 family protein [Herbiconiux sp. CPCC 205763]|uniref:DUF6264 family protein n=1 Tax=Herbiconiux aconitum TaxID=2970913 RepID=A0ABT2GVS4_9MICO|nr:DUF6264 family protein [Herbiconiux aconitum]MCS5718981.1 DUF6264 family protein [Herbiconiux aconitum]
MTTTPPDDSTPTDASAAPDASAATAAPPQRERPRFGEYAPTPATPTAPPAAVTPPPAAPAPQYAQPPAPAPQYTGYQSPLGSAGSAGSAYAYPGQALASAAPRPKTVGIIAFVVGLVLLIGSPIASVFVAQGFSPLMAYYADGTIDVSQIPADELAAGSGAVFGMVATLLFAAIFGLWALIQGIVATATNRGRLFGILAIVCSVLAPIVSLIVFYAALFAATPELLQR